MFSGLNLAVFSVSRLRLEIEAALGDREASQVLTLRADPNLTLTTILWGNVAVNVLLTLLSDSMLTGVAAFLFSTFAITIFGEILPQAYFSRHAIRIASTLAPILRVYGAVLYPLPGSSR
jgi:CBS domain containing-hemolysin-like protein